MTEVQHDPLVNVAVVPPTLVSPQLAEAMLSRRKNQRPVSKPWVATLAGMMRAGKWTVSPAPIAFDTQGNLVDGQHRLLAVVDSGVTCPFLVLGAFASDVVAAASSCRPLSTSDLLSMSMARDGAAPKNVNNICAIARAMVVGFRSDGGKHPLKQATVQAGKDNNELLSLLVPLSRRLGAPVAAAFANAVVVGSADIADVMVLVRRCDQLLFNGHGDPMRHLSDYIMSTKVARNYQYMLGVAAVRNALAGKTLLKINPAKTDFEPGEFAHTAKRAARVAH